MMSERKHESFHSLFTSKWRANLREDKSITVQPLWVFWVVFHDLVPEDVGDWSHTHWRTWVAGVGLEGGIDLS